MQLQLHNFRCFTNLEVNIPNHNFIILDDNGSGKTTILSALYSLFCGEAFGQAKFLHYLQTGQEYFGISCEDSDFFLNGKISPSGRLVTKWNKHFDTNYYLSKHFNQESSRSAKYKFLTYQPNDNLWLFQSRSAKLAQLDQVIQQSFGPLIGLCKQLDKLTKHKLQLLKHTQQTGQVDSSLINFISDQIMTLSLQIWSIRLSFYSLWQKKLVNFSTLIQNPIINWQINLDLSNFNGQKLKLQLPSQNMTLEETKTWLNTSLHLDKIDYDKLFQKELLLQKVLFGAQRDDFTILANSQPVENRLSRGEMRLFVLFSRQMASCELSNIWLLDDLFNELDDKREKIMLEKILFHSAWIVATGTRSGLPQLKSYSVKEIRA